MAKLHYEPQRYHHSLFEHIYTLITGKNYRRGIEEKLELSKQLAEEE